MNNTKDTYTIYLGSDHAGFYLKEEVKSYLTLSGYHIFDFGAEEFSAGDDYPEILHPLALMLSLKPENFAFVFGASGIGEMIVLNRHAQVRCGVFYGGTEKIITQMREHNNINALSFGASFIEKHACIRAVEIFLQTNFTHEQRHERRIKNIESLQSNNTGDYSE